MVVGRGDELVPFVIDVILIYNELVREKKGKKRHTGDGSRQTRLKPQPCCCDCLHIIFLHLVRLASQSPPPPHVNMLLRWVGSLLGVGIRHHFVHIASKCRIISTKIEGNKKTY